MYDKIIPLGFNCNVTFLLGHNNLKKESSLFEWFETKNFEDIVDVIEKLSKIYNDIENHDINFKHSNKPNGVIIEKDSIFSAHYNIHNYREIFNRRCKRFFDDIIKSKSLLFMRVKINNNIDDKIISKFENIIRTINPNLEKLNLMLIDNIYNENIDKNNNINTNGDFVIKRYIDLKNNKNTFKDFDNNTESIEKFAEIMMEFGYPKNINRYFKNDKL
jgi:hypothetical protein